MSVKIRGNQGAAQVRLKEGGGPGILPTRGVGSMLQENVAKHRISESGNDDVFQVWQAAGQKFKTEFGVRRATVPPSHVQISQKARRNPSGGNGGPDGEGLKQGVPKKSRSGGGGRPRKRYYTGVSCGTQPRGGKKQTNWVESIQTHKKTQCHGSS